LKGWPLLFCDRKQPKEKEAQDRKKRRDMDVCDAFNAFWRGSIKRESKEVGPEPRGTLFGKKTVRL